MTTKEKIAVMQAYVEGKKVQIKTILGVDTWCNCYIEPDWNWHDNLYRVKPEDKYRPYKDYREMVEDFCERFGVNCPEYSMPLIWLKHKTADYVCLVDSFRNDDDTKFFLNDKFDSMTYLDGSPVGKKVEE